MQPGEIWSHAAFYVDDAGEIKTKYLLVMAAPRGGDIVAPLLTSRAYGRPENPRCYHGLPYGGYFLGVLGGQLTRKSWVDLRYLDDLDPIDVRDHQARGLLARVSTVPVDDLCALIECAAGADDTTRQQERCLRDTLATLR